MNEVSALVTAPDESSRSSVQSMKGCSLVETAALPARTRVVRMVLVRSRCSSR